MIKNFRISASIALLFIVAATFCGAQNASSASPISATIYDRTRVDAWQWFAAPPEANTYDYVESLLRIGVAQRIHRWDWALEFAQPSVLDAPNDAVSPVTAQGQLGLGGTYYASNGNTPIPGRVSSSRDVRASMAKTRTCVWADLSFLTGKRQNPQMLRWRGCKPTACPIALSATLASPMHNAASTVWMGTCSSAAGT